MNLRTFFKSVVVILVTPWQTVLSVKPSPKYIPILKQVFPKTPEELPGLICKWIYDNQPFPYEIVREYDDWKDTWDGPNGPENLYNPRRNKWWAKDVTGKTVLIVTGMCFNDPETLFFRKV